MLASAWLVVLGVTPGLAATRRPELAEKAYLHAVQLQQKLHATSTGHRTVADYERVIREYRDVYLYDFAYVKAPVASEAMGDLYVEMGRLFHDPDYFQSAIKSYQYTASQYPGTSMARESAFAVGNVYLEDLTNPDQATDSYRAFLEKYPGSSNADEAKKKLKEIADVQAAREQKESASVASADGSGATANDGSPIEVTDIHNWVGPNYTRVVIEAKGQFQYTTLRLSNPDRIVFDLPNTHLNRDLVKKSLPMNGAFLRDIRVGQFKPDVTRVVLDVKDIGNFSAFPVPNPYRLIIDVHGSGPEMSDNSKPVKTASSAGAQPRGMARQAELRHPPKTGSAIEFDDQQSVMDKALAASKSGAEKATNQHVKLVSDRQPLSARPTASDTQLQKNAKPEKEIASRSRVAKPAKPKAGATHDSKDTSIKTDAASAGHVSPVAKKAVELASTEAAGDDELLSAKPASPTFSGSQTLTRALGLKVARVVIDPGHGGHDTGTIGPSGLEEKDLVLDIGLRLRKLIENQTNSEVFMTRSTDKFIPLEERTAIANEAGADLFISIHANASSDHSVRGIETYFLNFTSDPEALQLAARENATSQESVHELQDLIQKIALNNKIEESQELARDIQTVLYKRMSRVSRGIHNRGVRKAPFVVLIGANMPSILTEISFLSNAHSERLLKSSAYREQVAKALFNGIESYIGNLGSVRVAQSTQ